MLHLPPLSFNTWVEVFRANAPILAVLSAGLLGYGLSMFCWFMTLRSLPLTYAYPMLSLSYVLVCLLAAALPQLNESLGIYKPLGIGCILLGVWLINSPGKKSKLNHSTQKHSPL
jgi:undecaprenyl phosphate-alpha-L-ara4N flippase subunit ArnF